MRISVNVSEETNRRLTEQAKKIGTSKGAMLTMWINEKLNSIETTNKFLSNMFESDVFKEAMKKGMLDQLKEEMEVNKKSEK